MTSNLSIEIIHLVIAVLSFSAVIIGYLNSRKIKEVHLTVNGRIDSLLESSKQVAFAEGREVGRSEK